MVGERFINLVGALAFCLAVTVFLYVVETLQKYSEHTEITVQTEASLAEESRIVYGDIESITYEQLVAELMTDTLEYDILIGDRLIEKNKYNSRMISEYLNGKWDTYDKNEIYSDVENTVIVKYEGIN